MRERAADVVAQTFESASSSSEKPAARTPRKRAYHQSGLHLARRTTPQLRARIADETISDEQLTPLERAVRDWRREVLNNLGGADVVSAAQRALIDAAVGSVILLQTVDAYLFDLAMRSSVVDRRHRRVWQVVADRTRLAEGLTRQLLALGLERG